MFSRLQRVIAAKTHTAKGSDDDDDDAGGDGGERRKVHSQVLASALLCAASTCHALGPLALPKLPAFVPAVLDVLEAGGSNSSGGSSRCVRACVKQREAAGQSSRRPSE